MKTQSKQTENKVSFIIDFDSTFIRVEALDTLAEIALKDNPKRDVIVKKIQDITTKGMNGEITFSKSLKERLALFNPSKKHIEQLVKVLKKNITPSFRYNKETFKKYKDSIYIISGGFKDYIIPVVSMFGIRPDHVLANEFVHNKAGEITGYDETNFLSQDKGKVKQVKALGLKGVVYVVGDGYTDYEIKQSGLAEKFFVFCENIKRDSVLKLADHVLPNLDELLYVLNYPRRFSYPKHRIKALLLEDISPTAISRFKEEGYGVEALKGALSEEELMEKIKDVSLVGIRSKTKITKAVLEKAKRLHTIGAFCIGVNQIDLAAAAQKGIAVFNAPYSNTRSVVELILGEIIMLARKTFEKSTKLHQGIWDKSASGSFEVRGKTLGIVGYGNIGSQLSVLAEMMGMKVCYFDISEKLALGNARKCETLEELLKIADIITLHVDGRKENQNLISDKEFKLMKNGVLFLNASRGFVVDIEALVNHIKSGKIGGAAVDVFPVEPKKKGDLLKSELQNLSNVILTPHVGGSTIEAQNNIGQYVSEKIISFMNTGNTILSVNFPNINLSELTDSHRILHIHENKPGILAQINSILASRKINIDGQYLKTNEEIGYVITDVNAAYDKGLVEELRAIPYTIKVRVLY